jgi:hypothetical protein
VRAAGQLSTEQAARSAEERELLDWAEEQAKVEGLPPLAARIPYDPANLRKVLAGTRRMSSTLLKKLRTLQRLSCS